MAVSPAPVLVNIIPLLRPFPRLLSRNISEAQKKRWENPEERKKQIEVMKKGKRAAKYRKKAIEAAKRRLENPEARKNLREAAGKERFIVPCPIL
jgi:hypothetical protein